MTTTLEAIYEHGIFKPISSVPAILRENEKVRIIIETEIDRDLQNEFTEWETASDIDLLSFKRKLEAAK